MATKKKGNQRQKRDNNREDDLGIVERPVARLAVPTGNPRHVSWIREGRISHEIFAKDRLSSIPVEEDYE